MMEKLLEQEAMMEEDQKVSHPSFPTSLPHPRIPLPSPPPPASLSRAGGYSGSCKLEGKPAPLPRRSPPPPPHFLQTPDHRIS